MPEQNYCLRWNNHQPNFISTFSSLLSDECLVDVTLAADGRFLQAHKMVLSAGSVYFRKLFSVNPCQHPIVFLKDVSYQDLQSVIDFMYHGEINVSQDRLESIVKTAVALSVKGLSDMAVNFSSSQRKNTEDESAEIQLPSKRKRFKKCNQGDSDVQNVSGDVEIIGLGEVTQKTESVPTNIPEYGLISVKEEIPDQDYGNSAENVSNPSCSTVPGKVLIKLPTELPPSMNQAGISVITGVKKRGKLLIRQGNVMKPVDHDNGNDENDAEHPENRRTLIRQYSDPTPHQNQPVPDSMDTSVTSAKKSKYLSITNSHLQKQNSDSALTVPHEGHVGQPSTLLTDLINDPIKFQYSHPKSNHCPTLRPGPALGCNFCWNTIDLHGRILRRKTKYHCLECRTNLCIVPCFQDYHNKKESEMETLPVKENSEECSISSPKMNSTKKQSLMDGTVT